MTGTATNFCQGRARCPRERVEPARRAALVPVSAAEPLAVRGVSIVQEIVGEQRHGDRQIDRLYTYAKMLRCEAIVRTYLEVLVS